MIHVNKQVISKFVNDYLPNFTLTHNNNNYTTHAHIRLMFLDGVIPTKEEWHANFTVPFLQNLDVSAFPGCSVVATTPLVAVATYGRFSSSLSIHHYPVSMLMDKDNSSLAVGFTINTRYLHRPLFIASSTPTWFAFGKINHDEYTNISSTIVGTVGGLGSGADVEISNTAPETDQELIIRDIDFTFSKAF